MVFLLNILFLYGSMITFMQADLQKIREASEGLLFMSEADYPFELVYMEEPVAAPDQKLLALSGKEEGSPLEKVDLPYFFRNQVRVYPESSPEQQARAQRFQRLQQVLQEELTDVEVYRIGTIDIDAFIIGKGKDGRWAGLRTRLIET